MRSYRFYRIGQNGHVAGAPSVCEAPSDLEAVRLAREAAKGDDIEIWLDTRLVAYVTPQIAQRLLSSPFAQRECGEVQGLHRSVGNENGIGFPDFICNRMASLSFVDSPMADIPRPIAIGQAILKASWNTDIWWVIDIAPRREPKYASRAQSFAYIRVSRMLTKTIGDL